MSAPSNSSDSRVNWYKLLPFAASFIPLLYWHIAGLLQKTHYQFLFLLPFAIWLLAGSCKFGQKSSPLRRSEAVIGGFLLIVAFFGLGLAAWVWSPWVASVAFLLGWAGVLLATVGWAGLSGWLPLWLFCWIIVPLPFGMDEELIVRLRGYTTRMSSGVLDQLGVLHNSYANVIELPGKPLFIADACSGIHSLYVLMAAALFLCAWGRRGPVASVCLLVSTFGLVLIENVARIVAVAVAWGKGWDWSTGTNHELLGIALFGVSLFLIFTTDQLLLFFFPPDAPSLAERFAMLRSEKGSENRYLDPVNRKQIVACPAGLQKIASGLVFLFPMLLLAQLLMLPSNPPNALAILDDTFDLPELGKDALPATLAGFTLEKYSKVERVPEDPFGQGSQQWEYRKGDISCLMSVDYPYPLAHDLTICYTNTGWNITNRARSEVTDPATKQSEPVALVDLDRTLYGRAFLVFNHTRLDGRTEVLFKDEVAGGDMEKRAGRRWESLLKRDENQDIKDSGSEEPYLQFQLFVRLSRDLSETEQAEVLELFRAAKSALSAKVLKINSSVAATTSAQSGA